MKTSSSLLLLLLLDTSAIYKSFCKNNTLSKCKSRVKKDVNSQCLLVLLRCVAVLSESWLHSAEQCK